MGESLEKLESQINQKNIIWKHELNKHQVQVDALQEKLRDVQTSVQVSGENEKKELLSLLNRLKTTAFFLDYLKSKARNLAVPRLAHASCGIQHEDGVGFIDRYGAPLSSWSKEIDLISFVKPDTDVCLGLEKHASMCDEHDAVYIGEALNSVRLVADVMEGLVKRTIMAEAETAVEKEKVSLGIEEITKKTLQIETMSTKVEEMEKFALGTNTILNEMRQKVEDMVLETTRQRQRAAENEQELCRVKQEFDSLRSYVSSLISVRETLISSEKQFQTMEKLFERLVEKTTHLEGEKMQKEAEVQKLMAENVRLSTLLDKKEAQLLAMNEQCKMMALNSRGI